MARMSGLDLFLPCERYMEKEKTKNKGENEVLNVL